MFKVRYPFLIAAILFCFFIKKLDGSGNDKSPLLGKWDTDTATMPRQYGFYTEKEALDSLVYYLVNPKLTMEIGFLSEDSFVFQVRKVDTLTPLPMVHAQYVQYKYRVQKGVVKFRKYLKNNSLNLKKKDSTNGLPALISWPPVVYKSKGKGFEVNRYEVEITKRKYKFILQYELWWINNRAYWNSDFRYYSND